MRKFYNGLKVFHSQIWYNFNLFAYVSKISWLEAQRQYEKVSNLLGARYKTYFITLPFVVPEL